MNCSKVKKSVINRQSVYARPTRLCFNCGLQFDHALRPSQGLRLYSVYAQMSRIRLIRKFRFLFLMILLMDICPLFIWIKVRLAITRVFSRPYWIELYLALSWKAEIRWKEECYHDLVYAFKLGEWLMGKRQRTCTEHQPNSTSTLK